jgi:hypothetical protein
MKWKDMLIFLCALALSLSCSGKTKAADFVIQNGDDYTVFEVSKEWFGFPTPVVDMVGGHVGDEREWTSGMYTYDSGTLNVLGGTIDYLHTYNSSTVNISGGLVSHFDCRDTLTITCHNTSTITLYDGAFLFGGSFHLCELYDSSVLNLYGGKAVLFLIPNDSSTVNIYAGNADYGVSPQGSSTVNVYGGDIDVFWDNVWVPPTATINIYGYGFNYNLKDWWHYLEDPCDGWWVSKLTGYGCDGRPITYRGLPDLATHPNINLIPDFVPGRGVDLADFAILTLAWQSRPGDDNWNPICDISDPNDNVIDERDLAILTKYWLAGVK